MSNYIRVTMDNPQLTYNIETVEDIQNLASILTIILEQKLNSSEFYHVDEIMNNVDKNIRKLDGLSKEIHDINKRQTLIQEIEKIIEQSKEIVMLLRSKQ